jgi:hypothetical protein
VEEELKLAVSLENSPREGPNLVEISEVQAHGGQSSRPPFATHGIRHLLGSFEAPRGH